MPISVDVATKIIFVPQNYLTPLGGSAYELNVNTLRLDLKDWEDGEEGMYMPDTHRHNTTVTLGGVTLARTFEVINGYMVEFEDGLYSVSAVGANHNLADVMILNGVSLRSSNSAGLVVVSGGGGPGDVPTVEEIRMEMDAHSTKLAMLPGIDTAIDTVDAVADGIATAVAAKPSATQIRQEMDSNSTKLAILPGMNTNVSDIETAVAALDPPTAVEIRQEMDANSADLNAIQAAIAALPPAPSVTAIRQEMDANSADLNTIIAAVAVVDAGVDAIPARFTSLDQAVAAKPSAAQVRSEMDSSSTKLTGITNALTALDSVVDSVPAATADAMLAKTVEGSMTFLQWLRLTASILFGAGEVPTSDDGAFLFKSQAGTKNRIVGTLTDKVRAFTTRDGT